MIRMASDCTNFVPPKGEKFRTETFPPANNRFSRRRIRDEAPQITAPQITWSLEELTALATREHARLNKRQVHVAPRYWRLGRVLNLIRRKRKFPRGTWQPWLTAQEITKLNAFRARRLAKFFSSAAELRSLSLDEALEMARPKRGPGAAEARLRRWLKSVKKKAQAKLNDLDGVLAPDALRALIADATRQLAALDHALAALPKAQKRREQGTGDRGQGTARERRRDGVKERRREREREGQRDASVINNPKSKIQNARKSLRDKTKSAMNRRTPCSEP